jgi:hypothetical protein
MYHARHRAVAEILYFAVKIFFTFQLTTYIYFLNPARRPQSRKGRLAADALRQRRDGVKERGSVKSEKIVLSKM